MVHNNKLIYVNRIIISLLNINSELFSSKYFEIFQNSIHRRRRYITLSV